MREPAFTPGPWEWWDGDDRVRVTEAAEQTFICEVVLLSNARLIAAAPDTHIAAASLVASLDPHALNPEQFIAWSALNDALTLARGEAD